MAYHTKEMAEIIGVSDATIRRWSREYAEFLSPTAQPKSGEGYYRRVYTRDDLLVLWTIQTESQRGTSPDDIMALLTEGERAPDLPPNLPQPEDGPIAMIPASTAITQVRGLQAHITYLESELEQAREISDIKTERIIALEQNLGESKAAFARLQGQMDAVDRERQTWQGERRLWLRGLLAVAVVAAVLLTIVLLLALTGGAG